jgi:signal transduction histidine kinase
MTDRWRGLHPVAQDALAAVLVAMAWFGAYSFWRGQGWLPLNPDAYEVAGVWTVGTVALRRAAPRWVLAAAVVAYPLVYGATLETEFHLLPILVAGYTAASSGRVRTGIAGAACVVAVLALWSAGDLTDLLRSPVAWSGLLFTEFAAAGAVGFGALVHRQRETGLALAARNAELERLREVEAGRAVVEERTRIARELHDVVAHHLTAVVIRSQAAERVAATRPEVASQTVGWIAATARDALAAIRQTVHVLRDESGTGRAPLAPGPSLADLRAIVDRVEAAGLRVDLVLADPLPALGHQVELAAVRIAQEALTNALRHAAATRAVVSLRPTDGAVVLAIDDDGRAGPPGPGQRPGLGMVGMRERATACGGRLDVGPSRLGGWRVRARLPV